MTCSIPFLFRQPAVKIQDLMLKFPHLPEKIFKKLDNKSLSKCREVSRSWVNIIDEKNHLWLRVVNIPTKLKKGNTYVHLAAAAGQIEALKTALNNEKKTKTKKEFCDTMFHHACKNGRLNIVEFLLKITDLKINFNAKSDCGESAFYLACIGGHSNVVKTLIQNAAVSKIKLFTTWKNHRSRCITPGGVSGTLETFFHWDKTPFHWVCKSGDTDVVKTFMENASTWGMNLGTKDYNGLTAFDWACQTGLSDVVKIFIENALTLGFNLDTKDNFGLTAFHWACQKGVLDVVKIFMENASNLSIDLNRKDNSGLTGFHWACQFGHSDMVKIFMKNAITLCIDVNITDNNGWTGFHWACLGGNVDVVNILMENAEALSINLNLKDNISTVTFHSACNRVCTDTAMIFIWNAATMGIDLASGGSGMTGFHWACLGGHSDVVKKFMETASDLGTDLNMTDKYGRTYGSDLSIDLNVKDKSGNTGFHWAYQMRKKNIVKILMENAADLCIDLNVKKNMSI